MSSIAGYPENVTLYDFLMHLYGDRPGTVALMHATWSSPNGKKPHLENVNELFLAWPATYEFIERRIQQHSASGREVYICPHLLKDKRRRKEAAMEVLTLWAEADDYPLPAGFPKPTASVETSPGRFHHYWRLTRPLPPEEAEALNARIADAIGCDPGWGARKGTANTRPAESQTQRRAQPAGCLSPRSSVFARGAGCVPASGDTAPATNEPRSN
jgi:hypothetical protein